MTGPSDRPRLIAIVGPTATGKSALAVALAHRLGGEVVSCDSTAVYRGFDIGTDKPAIASRGGVPHHLIDVADPTEHYSAARYVREASAAIRSITARARTPILAGGTGLYYRALTRGLFDGPGRNAAVRSRLDRIAERRGDAWLHRMVARLDPPSGERIQLHDRKRLIRALEVYFLTGRPLTDHFAETRRPLPEYDLVTLGLRLAPAETARRVAARVDRQFNGGLLEEIRSLLASGVPPSAHPFSGLVYRQTLEHLNGVRDEAATRALITQENRRYARRQLTWFRKEADVRWLAHSGNHPEVLEEALALVEGPEMTRRMLSA